MTELIARIIHSSGTLTEWTAANPLLEEGELVKVTHDLLGVPTDSAHRWKEGPGLFLDLPYVNWGGGGDGDPAVLPDLEEDELYGRAEGAGTGPGTAISAERAMAILGAAGLDSLNEEIQRATAAEGALTAEDVEAGGLLGILEDHMAKGTTASGVPNLPAGWYDTVHGRFVGALLGQNPLSFVVDWFAGGNSLPGGTCPAGRIQGFVRTPTATPTLLELYLRSPGTTWQRIFPLVEYVPSLPVVLAESGGGGIFTWTDMAAPRNGEELLSATTSRFRRYIGLAGTTTGRLAIGAIATAGAAGSRLGVQFWDTAAAAWRELGARTVTDGVIASGALSTLTSATAVFTSADVGKRIEGTGIPANTYIGIRNSATSVGLSSSPTANTPVNGTAGTGKTVQVDTEISAPLTGVGSGRASWGTTPIGWHPRAVVQDGTDGGVQVRPVGYDGVAGTSPVFSTLTLVRT